MKCPNCGASVEKDDVFCENCGKKLELQKENKPTKKKWKVIVGILVSLIIVSVVFLYILGSQPQEYHMEAIELAEIMSNEKEMEQYYEDNLYIHGFIGRSNNIENSETSAESNHLYTLYSDLNDIDSVIFSYDIGLDEDIGSGSEVILKGTLGYLTESGTPILLVDEVEIKNKVEPVYNVGSVDDLLESSNDYINKKISVIGELNYTGLYGFCLQGYTYEFDVDIKLNNISDTQINQIEDYLNCVVVGYFYYDNGVPTIDVEEISDFN